MVESYKVESIVRVYHIYKDIWSAVVGTTLPWQERFNLHDSYVYAVTMIKDDVVVNHLPRSMYVGSMFSVPRITFPLFIIVSTTGFILSLIASIREDGMVFAKDLLSQAWQNSLTIIKIIIFFHAFVNFETILM